MPRHNDSDIDISKLQKSIIEALHLSSDQVLYEYRDDAEGVRLDLVTINPRHNQSFLFYTSIGTNKQDALEKTLDYIKEHHQKENTYTIQWIKAGESELQTSYFSAPDIYKALDKLYYGRDMNKVQVFLVKLNPIA